MAVDHNPYAVPTARVDDVAAHSDFIPSGRSRSFTRGWAWIAEGYGLFMRSPGTWIGLMLLWLLVMFGLVMIPFIGALALNLLLAVFLAGVMIGCHALWHDESLRLGHLFEGFKHRPGQLVLVALLYMVGTVVCFALAFLIGGGPKLLTSFSGGSGIDVLAALLGSIVLISLIMMALLIPLVMAFWFAPALVGINGLSAASAMLNSFRGCLKNVLPFLLWGVVIFGLTILLFVILSAVSGGSLLTAAASPDQLSPAVAVALIGIYLIFALAIGPIAFASTYAAYRDIYYAD